MSNSKHHIGIGCLRVLHKLLDILPFRSNCPNTNIVTAATDDLLVFLPLRGTLKGNLITAGTILGIQVWTFHVNTGNGLATGLRLGLLNKINRVEQALTIHAIRKGRKK